MLTKTRITLAVLIAVTTLLVGCVCAAPAAEPAMVTQEVEKEAKEMAVTPVAQATAAPATPMRTSTPAAMGGESPAGKVKISRAYLDAKTDRPIAATVQLGQRHVHSRRQTITGNWLAPN
jgi:hypothetical protein